ncbi:MAG: hydroxymethylglutaryl-CoA synthase [Acidilobaceae archaeon]
MFSQDLKPRKRGVSGIPRTGIEGWGVYIPRYWLPASEVARAWGWSDHVWRGLAVEGKAVANSDEDSTTMGFEASLNAILRAGIDPSEIGAVLFGSESKPYAVKPSATIIAEALGATPNLMASDLEFACRAVGEALRIATALVEAKSVSFALVIGSDTAQASPGDVLEFTAASGAAAFVIGARNPAALVEGSTTYVTDTPDFWRRDGSPYPKHGEGFTGEPAYFAHIVSAAKRLMEDMGLRPSDFKYAVFHQPNGKFPVKVAQMLGFSMDQIKIGLVAPFIGNTYNGSASIGLARVLDNASPGDRILLITYGSGAGSDAFSLLVTDSILEKKERAPSVDDYLMSRVQISYSDYIKFRNKIKGPQRE